MSQFYEVLFQVPIVSSFSWQAGEDDVTAAAEGDRKSNIGNIFKQSAQQKETRRNKLLVELSEAEELLGPALSDLEQFVVEAEVEVR